MHPRAARDSERSKCSLAVLFLYLTMTVHLVFIDVMVIEIKRSENIVFA